MKSSYPFDNRCIEFESLDQVQRWVLSSLLDSGSPVTSRGMPTLELFPISFALTSPRRRCITTPERKWNLPLAIGEFCWHASGSKSVQFIEYYAPRWREFSDGVEILGSCYGHNIFQPRDGKPSQWDRLINLLRTEPHSRRAVLQLFEPHTGLSADAIDAACTCSIQFLMRDSRLNAIVYMRSNDAIWGLPYDIFLFTMLQELLALQLGVELGAYFHVVGSLHLYRKHFELAKRIILSRSYASFEMSPMEEPSQLLGFLEQEAGLRSGQLRTAKFSGLRPYWKQLLEVVEWYSARRRSPERECQLPESSPYAGFLSRPAAESSPRAGALVGSTRS